MDMNLENLEYQFGDYRMSNSQQILFRGSEKVPLSTKIYYLLLTLVENTGKVLSKDEIIGTVWPGQVVTDTALAQQILRLRQILADNNRTQPLIETHRGVGYRFTAPVEVLRNSSSNTRLKPPHSGRLLVFVAMLVILLGIWLNARDAEMPGTGIQDPPVTRDSISMAIIPGSNNPDWLNRGGLDYLADLLGKQEQINIISPQPDWFVAESPEKLAIELTTNTNIHYGVLVKLRETENGYAADVNLRTNDEVVSNETLNAQGLTELFAKMVEWTNVKLAVHQGLDKLLATLPATIDSYALQSYMQGIFENETGGNLPKAGEYFQTAVNKDPEFLMAWIKLADNLMKMGKLNQAISIADTYLVKLDPDKNASEIVDLHLIKAKSYSRLRDSDRVQDELNLVIQMIDNTKDPYLKLAGLEALGLLARTSGDWLEAEKLAIKHLEISQQSLPLPGHLADLHLNLAKIQQRTNNFEDMLFNLDIALRYFENSNNANGMLAGFVVLHNMYLKEGRYREGVQVTARAEPYLDKATDIQDKMRYLETGAIMLNLRGHFEHANQYIYRMQSIGAESENLLFTAMAEFIKMHGYYLRGRYGLARRNIETTRRLFKGGSVLPDLYVYFNALDLLISARTDTPEIALNKLRSYKREDPLLYERFPTEVDRADGIATARAGNVNRGLEILATV